MTRHLGALPPWATGNTLQHFECHIMTGVCKGDNGVRSLSKLGHPPSDLVSPFLFRIPNLPHPDRSRLPRPSVDTTNLHSHLPVPLHSTYNHRLSHHSAPQSSWDSRKRPHSAVVRIPQQRGSRKRFRSISCLPTIPSAPDEEPMSYQWQNYGTEAVEFSPEQLNQQDEKKQSEYPSGQGMLDLSGVFFNNSDFVSNGNSNNTGTNNTGSFAEMPPPSYNYRPSLALDTSGGYMNTQSQSPYSAPSTGLGIDQGSSQENVSLATPSNYQAPNIPYVPQYGFIPQSMDYGSSQSSNDISPPQPHQGLDVFSQSMLPGFFYPTPVSEHVAPENALHHPVPQPLPQMQGLPHIGTISPSELGTHQPLKPTKSFSDLMMGSRASSSSSLCSQDVPDSGSGWGGGGVLDDWARPLSRALPPPAATSNGPTAKADPAYPSANATGNRPSFSASPLRNSSFSPTSVGSGDIDSAIRQYIRSPNRLGMGERRIIVMSPKVGQKSYGTEKRFLCPHPQAMLIGSGWWTRSPDGSAVSPFQPPRVNISLTAEIPVKDAAISWTDLDGSNIDEKININGMGPDDRPFLGCVAGKNLHISDQDPKRKDVRALVTVKAPISRYGANGWGQKGGKEGAGENVIGVFESKDIKIISKPSKKRSTAKSSEFIINHGTTIALFNRIKSQTTSTRYLSVTPDFTCMPGSDGRPVSGAKPPPRSHAHDGVPGFTVDSAIWESWIIWLVDPSLPSGPSGRRPPSLGWPSPPANTIPTTTLHPAIRYNSTVVLQSLQTGAISPNLVIRRIESDADAVGMDGIHQDGHAVFPPGELGSDLVSQLQKVAFEIHDPSTSERFQRDPKYGGQWLSCVHDSVKQHNVKAERRWATVPVTAASKNGSKASSLPSTPSSPVSSSSSLDYFGHQAQRSSGHAHPLMSPGSGEVPLPSTDGGPVRRQRTASIGKGPLARPVHRKRPSVDSAGSGSYEYLPTMAKAMSAQEDHSPRMFWTMPVGDNAVWSIIGVEQASYTFYTPPMTSYENFEPVAPFPAAHRLLPSNLSAETPKEYAHHYTSLSNTPLVTM
ncbi:hypothetical protein I350_02367 [Cryptococcus amylolentus CBS 6273]|nr:hypothetical protein I350_02367 [Cryptococcus amylolentus CBS 6273]